LSKNDNLWRVSSRNRSDQTGGNYFHRGQRVRDAMRTLDKVSQQFATAGHRVVSVEGLDVRVDGIAAEPHSGGDLFFAVSVE